LRMRIVQNAYETLISELANPDVIWNAWHNVFKALA